MVKDKETHRKDQKGSQGFALSGVKGNYAWKAHRKAWLPVGLIGLRGTCYSTDPVPAAYIDLNKNHQKGYSIWEPHPYLPDASLLVATKSHVPETPLYRSN